MTGSRSMAASALLCLAVVFPATAEEPPVIVSPGDDRRGYSRPDYETRSRALTRASGAAGPVALRAAPPLGLPPLSLEPDEELTPERVALGRKLFFDRRISGNGTMSCAMCHVPEHGFAHREMRTAVGMEGRSGRRNAPTILNAAYQARLFHDGRETALETQVWSPLLAAHEMGNPSVGYVLETLGRLDDYTDRFIVAFGRGPSMETVGLALASYQRTLIAGNSPFDRWHYGGDDAALSESARRGFALFTGRARCGVCHEIGPDWALFTDGAFHNTGIGTARAGRTSTGRVRVPVAPGETMTVSTAGLEHLGGVPPADLGRYEITRRPEDRWKFRTPMLRNVALTAPYMHDGSLATLADVVRFYNEGGIPNEALDPLIEPLGLSSDEQADLVSFLESLTSDDVAGLVAEALAAPPGE